MDDGQVFDWIQLTIANENNAVIVYFNQ